MHCDIELKEFMNDDANEIKRVLTIILTTCQVVYFSQCMTL